MSMFHTTQIAVYCIQNKFQYVAYKTNISMLYTNKISVCFINKKISVSCIQNKYQLHIKQILVCCIENKYQYVVFKINISMLHIKKVPELSYKF